MGLWDSVIGVGGDLLGAWIGKDTADDASDALKDSQQKGLAATTKQINRARKDIKKAGEPGLEDLLAGYQGALSVVEDPGQAEELALAFTGVLGPEREQQARDDFIASPGQDWLRDEQERALTRNASAIGGLGGGRVRTALQEQAFGRAATDDQRRLQNIQAMVDPEQQRSSNMSNLLTGAGQDISGFRQNIGTQLANTALGGLNAQVPFYTGIGQSKAAGILGSGNAIQKGVSNASKTLGNLFAT